MNELYEVKVIAKGEDEDFEFDLMTSEEEPAFCDTPAGMIEYIRDKDAALSDADRRTIKMYKSMPADAKIFWGPNDRAVIVMENRWSS